MTVRVVLAAVCLALALPARAQLSGNVSATTVLPGEVFSLTITAEGQEIGEPVLPQAAGFTFMNAHSPSISTGSRIQIINGQVSSGKSKSWTYQVRIDEEGNYTLPGISVEVDGKVYTTEPLAMTVSQNAPQRPQRRQGRSIFEFMDPFGARARPSVPPVDESIRVEDMVFFELRPEKLELYVGEPFTLTMAWGQIAVQGIWANAEIPEVPSLQGFYIDGDQSPLGEKSEERGKHTYNTNGKRLTLCPTEAGTFTIPSMEIPVRVRRNTPQGIDERVIVEKTAPITLVVKPLPAAPPDFSGVVGEIRVQVAVASRKVMQGTPVELSITVSGRGNPLSVASPEVPELEPWGHLSPAMADAEAAKRAAALKVFRYTLTPLEPGQHEIPALKMIYFSPEMGEFVPAESAPIPLEVIPAVQTAPPPPVAARAQAELRPIARGDDSIAQRHATWPANTLALALPPLGYAACLAYVRRRRRLIEDPEYARDYYARSKSQKRLAGVPGAADPTEALFHALAGFVADKLHVEEAGMTSVDAHEAIIRRGIAVEVADNVAKILRACERARYAGAQLSGAEINALLDAARQAMDRVEDALREGGQP